MTDYHDDSQGYGVLGEPHYTTDRRTWTWKRSLGSPLLIEPIGNLQEVVLAPTDETYDGISIKPNKVVHTNTSNRVHPELFPAHEVLSGLSRASQDVTRALDNHDPLVPNLLAFGSLYDHLNHVTWPVVAFPASLTRTRLIIIRVQLQRQGWGDDKQTFIRVPHIGGEQGYWDSPAPIDQIVFCDGPAYSKGFLAVRTSKATFLIRARFAKRPIQGRSDLEATRLKISVISVLPTGFIGRPSHSSVLLNPWFASHIAVVDTSGRWQVLEADNQLDPDDVDEAKQIAAGVSEGQDLDGSLQASPLFDGWSRVVWIGNADTVIFCNRTTLTLVDVPSNSAKIMDIEGKTKPKPTWYLDLARDPSRMDRFFALTSTHLYLAFIEFEDRVGSTSGKLTNLRCLAKLRHNRDHKDTSLHLSTSVIDEDIAVLISSASSNLVTCYRFSNVVRTDSHSIVSDATLMVIPASLPASDIIGLSIYGITWEDFPLEDGTSSVAKSYLQRAVQFWGLTLLTKNMAIRQQMFTVVSAQTKPFAIAPPAWRSKLRTTGLRLAKSSFVVADDELDESELIAIGGLHAHKDSVQQSAARPSAWTLDYSKIYQRISEYLAQQGGDVMSLLGTIRSAMTSSSPENAHIRILTDFAGGNILVGDLDEANDTFNQFLHDLANGSDAPIGPLATSRLLGFTDSEAERLHIGSIYRNIVSTSLSPLNEEVPGRVRLAREHIARRIATQLCLASYAVKPSASTPHTDIETQSTQEDSVLQDSQLPTASSLREPWTRSSQIEPEIGKSDTGLHTSPFSALSRVSRYATSMQDPAPATGEAFSKPVLAILAHWDRQGPPEDYDWLETHSRLQSQAEEEEATASMTDKERQRLERKRARLADRKRREEGRMMELRSSQAEAPRLMLSSQIPASQSQSQMAGPSGSQSQRKSQGGIQPSGFDTDRSASQRGESRSGNIELAVRSSPPKRWVESPSQGLQPIASQLQSLPSQTQSQPPLSSQVTESHGRMGPPKKKVKRRQEGF